MSAVVRAGTLAAPIPRRKSDFLYLLLSTRGAWIGVAVLLAMLFLAATADFLTPYDPNHQYYAHTL